MTERIPPPPPDGPPSTADAFVQDEYAAEKLLKRYLDNHCANADAEGMSALCECRLCKETRTYLGMPTWAPDGPEAAPFGRQDAPLDLRVAGESMSFEDCDDMLDCIAQILDEHVLNGATHAQMIRWKLRLVSGALQEYESMTRSQMARAAAPEEKP